MIEEPNTLGDALGKHFEVDLMWLYLFDRDFADKASAALNPDVMEMENTATLAEEFISIRDESGKVPTYSMVLTSLMSRLAAVKSGTKKHSALNKALLLAKSLKQRGPVDETYRKFIEKKLQEYVTKRNTYAALMRAGKHWDEGDYPEILTAITGAMEASQRLIRPDMGIRMSDVRGRLKKYVRKIEHGVHAPIGIPAIDKPMRGGLEPGTLGVVLAPTHVGKSMFLVNAATACRLAGLNAAIISLELSDTDYMARLDARLTGVPINTLLTKDGLRAHAKSILRCTKRLKSELLLTSYGPDEVTVEDLRTYLMSAYTALGIRPDVVMIDYADYIKPSGQGSRDRERRLDLSGIMRKLRQLAVDLQCAVWTPSQTGRASFNAAMISMKDVSECLEKVQIADVVIAMCQQDHEREKNRMRLAVLKDRISGKAGRVVDCIVNTDTQVIQENPRQVVHRNLYAKGGAASDGQV